MRELFRKAREQGRLNPNNNEWGRHGEAITGWAKVGLRPRRHTQVFAHGWVIDEFVDSVEEVENVIRRSRPRNRWRTSREDATAVCFTR
jgi:hypothetical protein